MPQNQRLAEEPRAIGKTSVFVAGFISVGNSASASLWWCLDCHDAEPNVVVTPFGFESQSEG